MVVSQGKVHKESPTKQIQYSRGINRSCGQEFVRHTANEEAESLKERIVSSWWLNQPI